MKWRHNLVFWALISAIAGCSIVPAVSIDAAHTPPSRRHDISATPFFPQQAFQCGPAALAMVLGFHGIHRSPEALTPWLFTPDAKGSFPAELDAVARKEGFISYPVNDIASLLREVAADHPVLVLQNLGTSWYTRWHFAVAVGFDLDTRDVILRSGDLQRRITPLDTFDHTWARGGRWARVIVPPTVLPVSAAPLAYLKAAGDLEQTGPLSAAEQAYRTALAHWPAHPLATFGLGNTLLQQQRYSDASTVFATLVQQQPAMAEAWNNYAYALRNNQCPASALQAAHCALLLEPAHPGIVATVAELTPAAHNAPHCPHLTCFAPR